MYANQYEAGSVERWHERFGHLNFKDLKSLEHKNLVNGLSLNPINGTLRCVLCERGKAKQLPYELSDTKENDVLDIVHSDICGPFNVESLGGAKYFATFIDGKSRYVEVTFLKKRSEVFDAFRNYLRRAERETGKKIKKLRTDNAREYVSREFDEFLLQQGIQHQLSIEYTPQQNGVAERMNKTLVDMARCMLLESKLPKCLWAEAINTAAFVRNRCPTTAVKDKTPFEVWFGKKPQVGFFKTFGCRAVALEKGPYKGYCSDSKGYRLWDGKSKTIYKKRDVKFFEKTDPKNYVWSQYNPIDTSDNETKTVKEDNDDLELVEAENEEEHQSEKDKDLEEETTPVNKAENKQKHQEYSEEELVVNSSVESEYDTPNDDSDEKSVKNAIPQATSNRKAGRPKIMRTGKPGRPKKIYSEQVNLVVNSESDNPISFEDAMRSPNKTKWIEAMDIELTSLKKNETWKVVDRPEGKRILSNKWVFCVKHNSDGSVQKYKARLVVRGCEQQKGVDYDEIFSPVARYETIRLLFALCAEVNMHLHHMDATTAFVQGELDDELYMEYPKTVNGEIPKNKVCQLIKPLYGLKQASRQWHLKLDKFLKNIRLKQATADQCIYSRIKDGKRIIILIYVDDLMIASDCLQLLDETKKLLSKEFEMKDLGPISSILGMCVKRESNTGNIEVNQKAYIEKLLSRFGMKEAKTATTPMNISQNLTKDIPPKSENEKKEMERKPYRELIGSLIYLAGTTRPDIYFAVNTLSRFCSDPGKIHWLAAKHLLRYLKGTINYKLVYKKMNKEIKCYVDADWAGDASDRRSVSGYVIKMAGSPISWKSKKQKSVALSTMEAEYMALTEGTKEVIYIRKLLNELGFDIFAGRNTKIFCDNQSAIQFSKDNMHHGRSKHIDIRYHFCRDKQNEGEIEVTYVSTNEMVADVFTKMLPKIKHEKCVKLLGLVN